jgi:spermidine synthase
MDWYYEPYKEITAVGIRIRELVHAERSAYQEIKVYDTLGHGRLLTLDGMVMLTELDEFVYHDLITHLPLCMHADPKRVLVIGGGDGGSVREILKHPSVEQVVLCEIDERVTRVCQRYIPSVAGHLEDPRVALQFADGVEFVRAHEAAFDVIVVDSSEPEGPAAGLFRRAFFADLRRALRPGGVIAAQTESPFYSAATVRDVYNELRSVFREVHPCFGPVPTYPGGTWTWALASDTRTPVMLDRARAAALRCRYFNLDIAAGAFALPNFIRELVDPAPAR